MKSKIKKYQPWLDADGNTLSDEMLKVISKTWCQNTWNDYLNFYTDEKEDSRTELTNDSSLEDLLNNSIEPTFLTGGEYVPLRQKSQLNAAMKSLTFKQKFVIEKIFLKKLSENQVAELLGISRRTVREHKEAAIRQLKNSVLANPPIFTLSEGATQLRPHISNENEEVDI